MKAYVYLESIDFVNTWVNGGELPIASIKKYLCDEEQRGGNLTPDEGVIDNSTIPQRDLGIEAVNSTMVFVNCWSDRKGYIRYGTIERFNESGIVLCASKSLKKRIASKFKRDFCVKIHDISKLQAELNRQLNAIGALGVCEYTKGHKRNCFLKSWKDSWQEEVRIFWKDLEPTNVQLPPGLAVEVKIPD
ncbi:hypothetical protein [Enterobacter sichuanensis]|uniref:hypothetical protein n=1 Tax=Enterobacter sichuanensis TaxID=2071710 RepID=UPI001746BEF1|nr:hypothetical protein [Enterobacter sichuanensis]